MSGNALPLLIGGGSALSAFGTYQSGKSDAKALERQAAIAAAQAFADEQQQRREARQVMGSQAAAFAQAGGGMGGTAGMVIEQSAVNAELDALNIRYGGLMRREGLLAEAKARKREATLGAFAQLLSGGSKAYSAYKMQG